MASLDPPGGTIPTTPDQLTATWLATVFTRHGFSAAIESIDFRPLEGASLTSEILRVVPRVQDETTGFAPPLIWKRSPEDAARRDAFRRGYAAEVAFYRDVAPHTSVAVPRCFVAAYDHDTGDHVLLLEDLQPRATATASTLLEGVTPAEAEAALSELARLHAETWRTATAVPVPRELEDLRVLIERHAPASTPYLADHVDDHAAARTQHYATEVQSLFATLASGPQAVVHGDAHPGNVIRPESPNARPHLIDWQGSSVDAPLRDVARFLVLGLTTEDRRAHEHDLLAAYLDQLEPRGARYDTAAALRHYRLASRLQWGWAVLFLRHQPIWDAGTRSVMPSLVQRVAAAFDDATS